MHLSNNEKKALDSLRDALRGSDFDLIELRLFGSKARGDSTRESDVDVAVVLRKVDYEIEQTVFDLCFEISVEHDLLLAPIVLSLSETKSEKHRATPFFKLLEREGVAV